MASKPKIPDPLPPPAKRPERQEAVEAEDIVLGGEDELDKIDNPRKKGKRSLSRPSSGINA
jgi:hypothetical protein